MIHPSLKLRDLFAIHATDADIADAMTAVMEEDTVVTDHNGNKRVVKRLPPNARQLARYIHAERMLAVSNSVN